MEVMSTMNKISDVLTVTNFMLFIVLKIFEKNNVSMASLLCGAIFYMERVCISWRKDMTQKYFQKRGNKNTLEISFFLIQG